MHGLHYLGMLQSCPQLKQKTPATIKNDYKCKRKVSSAPKTNIIAWQRNSNRHLWVNDIFVETTFPTTYFIPIDDWWSWCESSEQSWNDQTPWKYANITKLDWDLFNLRKLFFTTAAASFILPNLKSCIKQRKIKLNTLLYKKITLFFIYVHTYYCKVDNFLHVLVLACKSEKIHHPNESYSATLV